MECDLIPYFGLHLQIGTFSCRWGQLFLRCLLRCWIIRLNYTKNAGQVLSPFPFSSSLFGPAVLCFPVGMQVSDGRGANHVLSFLSTHLHSEGLLSCTHIFKECGSLTSGRRQREQERERERQRESASHRGPSVHLWNDLAPQLLSSWPSMADVLVEEFS